MKRIALAVATASLFAGGINAGAAAAATYDSVEGAIWRTKLNSGPDRHFVVSAHAGPNGAKGHYQATYGQGKTSTGYTGRVTCVQVFGNRATVGIYVTKSTFSEIPAGTYENIYVVDNGNPASGGLEDAISPGPAQAGPVSCTQPLVFELDTQLRGNVLVKAGS
jgi:hypothetical protein